MTEMFEKDMKKHPLRPKRQDGMEIPVRMNFLGGAPESQNQRARIAMGDKGIKNTIDEHIALRRRQLQAEALRK